MAKWWFHKLQTQLTVEQCAQTFRAVAESSSGAGARVGGLTRRLRGQDAGGFYTPDAANDPFAQFDSPDFSVGVHIPKFANNDVPRNIQMTVWDRGEHRVVELATNRSGRSLAPNFIGAIRAADPRASDIT